MLNPPKYLTNGRFGPSEQFPIEVEPITEEEKPEKLTPLIVPLGWTNEDVKNFVNREKQPLTIKLPKGKKD